MRPAPLLIALVMASGCGADDEAARHCSAAASAVEEPATRCALEVDGGEGAVALELGLYLVTSHAGGAWTVDEATTIAQAGLDEAGEILTACGIGLSVAEAEVVVAPPELLVVEGNLPGAWGGVAPPGETDPDLFNYAQNARLAAEPRALFGYAHERLPHGAIAVVVVDGISYWSGGDAEGASQIVGGLSFPPVVYHRPEDFPERNGVLVAASYPSEGAIPNRINGQSVAHELGHMLLDTAQHPGPEGGLMQGGRALTDEQCATMRAAATEVYGDAAVVDPRG